MGFISVFDPLKENSLNDRLGFIVLEYILKESPNTNSQFLFPTSPRFYCYFYNLDFKT